MKRLFISIGLWILSAIPLWADTGFVKGADIGFLPMQERFGQKFYDTTGKERECLDLLQDYQISAVRLRVWVNPERGSNGKEEVLRLARRAKEKGMDIMLSFHYSDCLVAIRFLLALHCPVGIKRHSYHVEHSSILKNSSKITIV